MREFVFQAAVVFLVLFLSFSIAAAGDPIQISGAVEFPKVVKAGGEKCPLEIKVVGDFKGVEHQVKVAFNYSYLGGGTRNMKGTGGYGPFEKIFRGRLDKANGVVHVNVTFETMGVRDATVKIIYNQQGQEFSTDTVHTNRFDVQ